MSGKAIEALELQFKKRLEEEKLLNAYEKYKMKKAIKTNPAADKAVASAIQEAQDLTKQTKKEIINQLEAMYDDDKKDITNEIVKAYKNNFSSNFQNLKEKALPIYFNNDINLFNKAIDKELGYKEFTLVVTQEKCNA